MDRRKSPALLAEPTTFWIIKKNSERGLEVVKVVQLVGEVLGRTAERTAAAGSSVEEAK